MLAYEFYWREPIKEYHYIGTPPERRKNPARITQESVMNWGVVLSAERHVFSPTDKFLVSYKGEEIELDCGSILHAQQMPGS
jgi:hypothetical protein